MWCKTRWILIWYLSYKKRKQKKQKWPELISSLQRRSNIDSRRTRSLLAHLKYAIPYKGHVDCCQYSCPYFIFARVRLLPRPDKKTYTINGPTCKSPKYFSMERTLKFSHPRINEYVLQTYIKHKMPSKVDEIIPCTRSWSISFWSTLPTSYR